MPSNRPILAVVSARPAGDGVGFAGLLLARALAEISGEIPRIVSLDAANAGRITRREQLAFLSRLTLAQRSAPALPVVFNHVGIARAQSRVPALVRRKYAVLLHGIEVWDAGLDAARMSALRAATVRLSNSRYTAKRVAEVHPAIGAINPCPLALFPESDAVQPGDATEAARLIGSDFAPTVVIVGRMSSTERYKGHDELIECWPAVQTRIPNARLFCVGRGNDVERLRSKAASAGVGDFVIFTGFVADGVMRQLITRCQVFAMPSRGEGFGLAYLEAMRCGLPCIGSDADAASEVIADGETGRIVAASEVGSLASAILDLLENPDMARRMGERGRIRERDTFAFSKFRESVRVALVGVAD